MKDVVVFSFTDPFSFISSCQKANLHPWTESYRKIAKHFSLGGAYFWLVIHGKKPFPRKIIDKLPSLMSLNDKETDYFKLLMYLSTLDMNEKLKIDVLNKFRPAAYHKAGLKRRAR
jgi:hypothetical protein